MRFGRQKELHKLEAECIFRPNLGEKSFRKRMF